MLFWVSIPVGNYFCFDVIDYDVLDDEGPNIVSIPVGNYFCFDILFAGCPTLFMLYVSIPVGNYFCFDITPTMTCLFMLVFRFNSRRELFLF